MFNLIEQYKETINGKIPLKIKYVYYGNPKNYDKDNDYDFIIINENEILETYIKPESLKSNDIIYCFYGDNDIIKHTKKDFK